MSETIYVVRGTTGKYSDRNEWPVKAFRNESDAQDLVTDAEEWAKTYFATDYQTKSWTERANITSPFDPDIRMDYTGTSYYYEIVELE